MFGPVLRGEKCTLRPPRKEELTLYQRWFDDPELIYFAPGIGPLSDAKEEDWFNQKAGCRESGMQRAEMFRVRRFRDIWMGEVLRDDWERAQAEPK